MKNYSDFGITVPAGSSGDTYTTCPQCSKHRKKKSAKCLSVNIEKKCWLCHHCSWSGSLKSGVNGKSDVHRWEKETTFTKPAWQDSKLPKKVLDYFAGRGIDEQVLKNKKVGYGKTWMPGAEDWVMAVQFPYIQDGEIVNIKFRDGRKNFKQVAGAKRIVYNIDRINFLLWNKDQQDVGYKRQLIFSEGEVDVFSWEMLELPAISVPDGAPPPDSKNYESKFTCLECIEEHIERAEKILLAFDSDPAGKKLEEEISRRIGREKCWRVRFPDDCKDANEVHVKHGLEVLYECYQNAEPYPIPGLITVGELRADLYRLYDEGIRRGESTGFYRLDKYFTVRSGEVTVVTGLSNHGKSSWINNLLMNLAIHPGWMSVIFSPENMPMEYNLSNLTEIYVHKPFAKGKKERMTKKDLDQALDFIESKFQFVYPPENDFNLDFILSTFRVSIFRYGAKVFLIDPWNYIDYDRPKDMIESDYIGKLIQRVSMFCKVNDVHGFIIAHPTKLKKITDKKSGKDYYPVPTLFDIYGSSNFTNKPDNGISIWRDVHGPNEVEIHIQKIRWKEVGEAGHKVLFIYNRDTGEFKEKQDSASPVEYSKPYKDDDGPGF